MDGARGKENQQTPSTSTSTYFRTAAASSSSSAAHKLLPVASASSSSSSSSRSFCQLDSPMDIELDAMNTLKGIIDIPSHKESRLVSTMPILRRGNPNSNDDKDVLLFCKDDLLERNFGLTAIGKKAIVRGEFVTIKKVGMLYMEVESIEFVDEQSQFQSQSLPQPRVAQSKAKEKTKTSKDLVGYIKIKSEIQNLNGVGSSAFVRFMHTSKSGQISNKATMVVLQKESLGLYPFLHRGDRGKNLYVIRNTKRANLTHDEVSDAKFEVRVSMDGLKSVSILDPTTSSASTSTPIIGTNTDKEGIHINDENSLQTLIEKIGSPQSFKDLERFSQTVYSVTGVICKKTGWNNHDWLVLKEHQTGSEITIITTHMCDSITFVSLRPDATATFHDVFPVYIGRSLKAFAGHSTRSYFTIDEFAPATTLSDSYVVRGSSRLLNRSIVYTTWISMVCRNMVESIGRSVSNNVYGNVIDSLQSLFDEASFTQHQKSPLVECIDRFYVPFHVIRGGLDVDYINELFPVELNLRTLEKSLKAVPRKNLELMQSGIEPAEAYVLSVKDMSSSSSSSSSTGIDYVIGKVKHAVISSTLSIFKLYDTRNASREIMVIVNGDMSTANAHVKRGSLLLVLNPKECLETIPGREDALVFIYVDYNIERGVEGSIIKRPTTTTTSMTRTTNMGEKLKVGECVKIRYRGRSKWYDGRIETINADGSYDVRHLEISNVTIIPIDSGDTSCATVAGVDDQEQSICPVDAEAEARDASSANDDCKDVGLKLARVISDTRLSLRRKLCASSSSSSSSSSSLQIGEELSSLFYPGQQEVENPAFASFSTADASTEHVEKATKTISEDWICTKCKLKTFASHGIYCYHCNWDCVLCGNTDNWGRRKECNRCKQTRGTRPTHGNIPAAATVAASIYGSRKEQTATTYLSIPNGTEVKSMSSVFSVRNVLSIGKSNVLAPAVKGIVIYKSMGPIESNNTANTVQNETEGPLKRSFSSIEKIKDCSPHIYLRDTCTNDFITVFLNGENTSFVLSSIFVGLHIVLGPVRVMESINKKSIFLKFDRNSGISVVGISTTTQLQAMGEMGLNKPALNSYRADIDSLPALQTTISELNVNQRKSRCLWNLNISITSIDKVRVYLYCVVCKKDIMAPQRDCMNCRNQANLMVKWSAESTVDDHTSVATADFEDFDVFKLLLDRQYSGIDMQGYVEYIEHCVRTNGEFGIFNNLAGDTGIPEDHLRIFGSNIGCIADFKKVPSKVEFAVSVLKILVDRISLIRPISIIGRVSTRKYDSDSDGYHPSAIRFQTMYGYQYVSKETKARPHVTFRVIHASLIE